MPHFCSYLLCVFHFYIQDNNTTAAYYFDDIQSFFSVVQVENCIKMIFLLKTSVVSTRW